MRMPFRGNASVWNLAKDNTLVDIAINLVMIIISVVLIFLLLLQTKGSAFGGSFGSGGESIQRTRRGFEKTLFQFTIGIALFFVGVAIISSFALS
jgi:preprotein translocase subunit SecG